MTIFRFKEQSCQFLQSKAVEETSVRGREPSQLRQGLAAELRASHGVVARVVGVRVHEWSRVHWIVLPGARPPTRAAARRRWGRIRCRARL